jgi:phosphopantetheinyl transferase
VSISEAASFELPAGAPQLRLLRAEDHDDEAALRSHARELAARAGARHSSRSYRFPYALLAWHSSPVGVDIERIEALEPAFLHSISTPAELAADAPKTQDYASRLWSSKEALAKALGDALDYDPRRLDSPMLWPGGRSGPWRALALSLPEGYVGWLCWRTEAADA